MISTVTPKQTIVPCKSVTDLTAGNKSVPCLFNGSMSVVASSEWSADHGLQHCILNRVHPRPTVGSSAWCAGVNDDKQYIVASCDEPRMFTGIATQGRSAHNQRVTSYTVRFTMDNVTWYNLCGGAKIVANTDADTVVAYKFEPAICARSIAIHPVTFNEHISMRCELYCMPVMSFPRTQMGSCSIGNRDLQTIVQAGTQPRVATRQVAFPRSFMCVPQVSCGIRILDCNTPGSPCYTTRVSVTASNITCTGFTCTFTTWSDSNVYDATIDYVAEDCGTVPVVCQENTVSPICP
eukprot:gene17684-21085_t